VSRKSQIETMLDLEALSIYFCSTSPFAVRVSVGGINALTGTKTKDREGWLDVDGQKWLDGVVVSPDLVRQFVGVHAGSRYVISCLQHVWR
jgi:hypothetical protein